MVQDRELYLQRKTNSKSYMIYRTAPYSATLNDRYPWFQCHTIIWCWISHTVPYTDIVSMFNSVISNAIEWLGEIFSDTKRRAGLSATAELLVYIYSIKFIAWCACLLPSFRNALACIHGFAVLAGVRLRVS